jgi:hypothetical protein
MPARIHMIRAAFGPCTEIAAPGRPAVHSRPRYTLATYDIATSRYFSLSHSISLRLGILARFCSLSCARIRAPKLPRRDLLELRLRGARPRYTLATSAEDRDGRSDGGGPGRRRTGPAEDRASGGTGRRRTGPVELQATHGGGTGGGPGMRTGAVTTRRRRRRAGAGGHPSRGSPHSCSSKVKQWLEPGIP